MEKSTDPRLQPAALWYATCPTMKLSDAMRAAKFTEDEIKSRTWQMRVRRHPAYKQKSFKLKNITAQNNEDSMPSNQSNDTTNPSTPKRKNGRKLKIRSPGYKSPKKKKTRRLSHQVASDINEYRLRKERERKAHKKATLWYANEKKKPKSDPTKKSAPKVTEIVNNEFNTTLAHRTISEYVQNDMAGMSPIGKGARGKIPSDVMTHLVGAFESYVRINQNNGNGPAIFRKNLVSRVSNVVCDLYPDRICPSHKLLERVLKRCKIELTSKVQQTVEDRRHRWTTYKNLVIWFDSWAAFLLKYGFATVNDNGDIVISEEQLFRIINIDETCLSFDGKQGNCGGRPAESIYDPNLPQTGKVVAKSSQTMTMICGINAAGESLPPHFQIPTTAKSDEAKRLRADIALYMHYINGKWGFEEECQKSVTFGMNERGGMDEDEFEKYIFNSIATLYPDVEDRDGKRIVIKLDGGPGRTNVKMLAKARVRGILFFPCVPNSTAITQELDVLSYFRLKYMYRRNLEKMIHHRQLKNLSTSIKPHLVGILIFGGTDPETDENCCENAFEYAFSKKRNLEAWAKVGAAPLTRKCLESKQVRHELEEDGGDENDPLAIVYKNMQSLNDMSVAWLNMHGFYGDQLRAKVQIKRKSVQQRLTVPNTEERIEAIKKVKSHGQMFVTIDADHYANDDFMVASERKDREKMLPKIRAEKKKKLAMQAIEEEAKKIVEAGASVDKLKKSELETLLLWQGIKRKDMPTTNPGKKAMWEKLKNRKPPLISKWTDEDEQKLLFYEKKVIDISETAVGRATAAFKAQSESFISNLAEDEREDFMQRVRVKCEEKAKPKEDKEKSNEGISMTEILTESDENIKFASI